MNVPHLYANFIPSLREGISRNVHSLVDGLSRAGDDVRLDAPSNELHHLNNHATYVRNGFLTQRLLERALVDPEVDLAHQHVSIASMGLFARAARLRTGSKKPILMHVWNAIHRPAEVQGRIPTASKAWHRAFNNRAAARWGLKGSQAVIVSSQFQATQLREAGHEGATFVIPNGVDGREYRPSTFLERSMARSDLAVGDAETVVLYYGHLTPWKGVDVFLDALPLFFRQHPGAKALISHTDYGNGEARLEHRLRELGIRERVVLHGPEYVPTLLAAADIAVLPPLAPVGTACHPNVLLECLSSSVATIASRIGSIPEAVHDGRTGLLFKPGDSEELAAKIGLLASDRTLRRTLGHAARTDTLGRFHWDEVVRRLRDVYGHVLDADQEGVPVAAEEPEQTGEPVPWTT